MLSADLVEAPIEGPQSNEDVYAESQSELRLSHLELRVAHAAAAAEPERYIQSYEVRFTLASETKSLLTHCAGFRGIQCR